MPPCLESALRPLLILLVDSVSEYYCSVLQRFLATLRDKTLKVELQYHTCKHTVVYKPLLRGLSITTRYMFLGLTVMFASKTVKSGGAEKKTSFSDSFLKEIHYLCICSL